MGTLDDRNFASSAGASQKKRKAVIQKESVETQDHMSCQGGRQQELGGTWFRPKCGGRTSSSQAHVRPGDEKGLKFQVLVAIGTDETGVPPTFSLCRE